MSTKERRDPTTTLRLDHDLEAALAREMDEQHTNISTTLKTLLVRGMQISGPSGDVEWRHAFKAGRLAFQRESLEQAAALEGQPRDWKRATKRASRTVGLRADQDLRADLTAYAARRGLAYAAAARDLLRYALGLVDTHAQAGELEGRAAAFQTLKDAVVVVRRAG